MLVSIIRFAAKGWIYDLYILPDYYFTYYGFDWVKPLGEAGMYALFTVMGLASLFVMLGWYYRAAIVLFFLSFTYVELIDKTNYLNHYYFVSIISFLLTLVPAHRYFSLDVWRKPHLEVATVPAWTLNIFKLQLGIVYVYAGLAKLNPDWLLDAMPLQLWLPAKAHLPLIGSILEHTATAYVFSWLGAFYDLFVVFFLLYGPARIWAYLIVVVFHLLTWLLFPIGMFPFIMILCTLIFFPAAFHKKLIELVARLPGGLRVGNLQASAAGQSFGAGKTYKTDRRASTVFMVVLGLHFTLQLLVPFRFALYPGHLFWTEQGYRFSWRVMLMEKAGHTTFHVRDPQTDRTWQVANWKYLTPVQEKMMATQPDMILQFAHYLEREYRRKGYTDVEIRAESFVTLNGRRSRAMVDPDIDLTRIDRGFAHKNWLLPYDPNNEEWLSDR
jgi:hypothetical protein